MVVSNGDRVYELNEVQWWSRWAEVTWFGEDAYAFFSKEFGESFFNRAGFVRVPPDPEGPLRLIEGEFEKRGRVPNVFVSQDRNTPRLLRALDNGGYRIADQMAVMELENPSLDVNHHVELDVGLEGNLADWVSTYLAAFYGEDALSGAVTGVMKGLAEVPEASLVLARLEKRPVGCLALYKSQEVCGVYCLSTHPDFRRMKVASTMLDLAHRMAEKEGRRVILQTILSDSLEAFYLKLGFARLYTKDAFVRDRRRS